MSKLRLDKYLADMGVGTRQEVKALIRKGRVAVDGITAKAPELKVDPDEAQVTVDGNSISYVKMEYWMLHKPAGVVSATEDRRDRTVLDLLSDAARKDLFPVGRLDKDTEGLLLITNDGALSHRLLSPLGTTNRHFRPSLPFWKRLKKSLAFLKAGSALPSVRAASTRSSACLRRSEKRSSI